MVLGRVKGELMGDWIECSLGVGPLFVVSPNATVYSRISILYVS